ncbi:MAG: GDSL-type esterase/lipase family protein [Polyangiaceae bacterium]
MRAYSWLPPIFAALGACGAHARSLPDEPADMPTVAHAAKLPVLPPSASSASAAATPPAHPPLVQPIENAKNLKRFFEALAKIDDGSAQSDVRIIQLGDSHTAADIGTNATRHTLQSRFGDGGRGFVALGRPWKTYGQEGVSHERSSRDWQPERGKPMNGKFIGDGMYGLAGYSLVSSKKGTLSSDVDAPSSGIEVAYLDSPNGGSFDLLVDGAKIGHVMTRDHTVKSGFSSFTVPDGPHHVELQANGDGTLRIFGAAYDRALNGVTLDALGINGERAINLLDWSDAHFSEQLRHRDPQLVVLAYGTNEAGDSTSAAEYEQTLVELLGRVARAVPAASCLMIGPQDRSMKSPEGWVTMPKVIEIIEVQKRVAQAAGCAYFDQFAAMGGAGSMAIWATETPQRGRSDHAHLTRTGYVDLGNAFAIAVMKSYDEWRVANGLPIVPPPHATDPLQNQPPPSSTAATPLISYPLNL